MRRRPGAPTDATASPAPRRFRPGRGVGNGHGLNLALIGLAITLDPLPPTAFIAVLPSKRGVTKGAAFVFGWLLSLAIVVMVTVFAPAITHPSRARHRPWQGWRRRSQ